MTLKDALLWANEKLTPISDSSFLDTELLLSFVLKKKKEYLYTYPEKNISPAQLSKFKKLVNRRSQGEPAAYIINLKEFFGLNFYVDKNVLIPRPETELLVEEVLRQLSTLHSPLITIIDVGTGSGCIAISLAKNLPKTKIFALDASAKALSVAKKNARRHGVSSKIKFLKGNLLNPLLHSPLSTLHSPLVITANLPYISDKQYSKLPPNIKKYEPRSALIAGPDGLKYYQELFRQIKSSPVLEKSVKSMILEIDPSQTAKIKIAAKKLWPRAEIEIKKDLAGLNRVAVINLHKK